MEKDEQEPMAVIFYYQTATDGSKERVPVMTTDASTILSPGRYKSGYGDLFNGFQDKRLYALYQGKAFRVWPLTKLCASRDCDTSLSLQRKKL
ncbi:hypothetical protein [Levilactobacillus wangkuiensis]|uniref:hypothetical protein n=1 Tax=Levilactobacillus wangkuiensis TaxID=2799566 RepID=UPI0019513611|nr:hypothetical protein [Levilactobacillus wangkuiensis]